VTNEGAVKMLALRQAQGRLLRQAGVVSLSNHQGRLLRQADVVSLSNHQDRLLRLRSGQAHVFSEGLKFRISMRRGKELHDQGSDGNRAR
jgi:hypothetical protein